MTGISIYVGRLVGLYVVLTVVRSVGGPLQSIYMGRIPPDALGISLFLL